MKRPVRVLLPWFERRDAVSALLGFRHPSSQEETEGPRAEFEAAQARLAARPPYQEQPPTLEPLPAALAEAGQRYAERARRSRDRDFVEFRAAVVDLRRVIAFQKAIDLTGIDDRVADAQADDWESLATLCLPDPDAVEIEDIRGTFDKDDKALTISSMNPNLRASGVRAIDTPKGRVFGVELTFGSPLVQVVEYRGRLFLRDGYHRSYGLLARGIHRVPCIYQRASQFSDVSKGGSNRISQEALLGPRPPMLTDFHHPDFSRTLEQQAFRKVIRLSVEQFVVHV